jgi:hypothetical protein
MPRGWAERIEGKWESLKGSRIQSNFIIFPKQKFIFPQHSYSLNKFSTIQNFKSNKMLFSIFIFGLFFGNSHQLPEQPEQPMNQAAPNHTSKFCLAGAERPGTDRSTYTEAIPPTPSTYVCVLASFVKNQCNITIKISTFFTAIQLGFHGNVCQPDSAQQQHEIHWLRHGG